MHVWTWSIALALIGTTVLLSCAPAAPSPQPEPQTIKRSASEPQLAFKTLPLHPPTQSPDRAKTVAIFLTGDGGWASFDQKVCADLSAAGVPTTGFDTGVYFSEKRDPAVASRALADTIEAVKDRWGAEYVVLVGYSFGADVAPFLVNRLPPALRSSIDRVALMSPSNEAPSQITLMERVGLDSPGARPVIPELKALDASGMHVACLYGERDHDAICPSLSLASMKTVKLRGGHGLDDDHRAVAVAILGAWPVEH